LLCLREISSKAVLVGSNVNFIVTGTGTALGYQWFFNGMPLVEGGRISGSATLSLTVSQCSKFRRWWLLYGSQQSIEFRDEHDGIANTIDQRHAVGSLCGLEQRQPRIGRT